MPDPIPTNHSVTGERAHRRPGPTGPPRGLPRRPRPAPPRPTAPRLSGGVAVISLAVALPTIVALAVLVSPAFLLLILLAAVLFLAWRQW